MHLDNGPSTVLRGRVASGLGDLTGWMRRYSGAYERATGQGDHGLDIVEVVATVHLRMLLGLNDGDRVEITVGA